jgi:hypothetical protein
MSTLSSPSRPRKPHATAHISTTHPEWPNAWESLCDLTGDYADCHPSNGECWQYMGSVAYRPGFWGHEFRHRDRPATANRQRYSGTGRCYVRLPASADFRG